MRVMLAEEIMKILGVTDIQAIYKVGDMIIADANDHEVIKLALERGLLDAPKCKKCKAVMDASYSDNGVLDSWSCNKSNFWTGKHEQV